MELMSELKTIIKYLFCLSWFFSISILVQSQNNHQSAETFQIAFYNTENLFDTLDNPLTRDEEFTPESIRRWNSYKYYTKLKHLYKVLANIGGWNPPVVIGLAEVENEKVLRDLINITPLKTFSYEIIHKESEDLRGIDIAAIYNTEYFNPITVEFINIGDTSLKTRPILYIKGSMTESDTIHLFYNHWPSRWNGKLATESKRIEAATTLKNKLDSIYKTHKEPKIIIAGDFNDNPEDKSLQILYNGIENDSGKNIKLVNLNINNNDKEIAGTQYYRGVWSHFDQVIISKNLLDMANNVYVSSFEIGWMNFLLTKDKKYLNKRPFRTYYGMKYEGGYSDHLPVWVNIICN